MDRFIVKVIIELSFVGMFEKKIHKIKFVVHILFMFELVYFVFIFFKQNKEIFHFNTRLFIIGLYCLLCILFYQLIAHMMKLMVSSTQMMIKYFVNLKSMPI